jgi:hypothetical protein
MKSLSDRDDLPALPSTAFNVPAVLFDQFGKRRKYPQWRR